MTPPDPIDAPERPIGELPLSAFAEQDGVRVTIALDRNPMPAGEATWMTVEVRNVGLDDLFYADPCVLVPTGGVVGARPMRNGRDWPGDVGAMKRWALDRLLLTDGTSSIGFEPEWAVERGIWMEHVGCDAMLVVKQLPPGAALTARARWNGFTVGSHAPVSGQVVLKGSFSFYWRGAEGRHPPEGAHERRVALDLGAEVTSIARPPLVDPGEAIDIALSDPDAARVLLEHPIGEQSWYLIYKVVDGRWFLGRRDPPGEPEKVIVIDAFAGKVLWITFNAV